MALIKCPECGKEISDKASVCINCGYPISEYVEEEQKKNEQLKEQQEAENNKYTRCVRCGVDAVGEDGYCESCGAYQFANSDRQAKTFSSEARKTNYAVEKPKFFERGWFLVLACIFIPPVGLCLLWVAKKPKYAPARTTLTVFLAIYAIIWCVAMFGESDNTEKQEASDQVVEEKSVDENSNSDISYEDQDITEDSEAESIGEGAGSDAAESPTVEESDVEEIVSETEDEYKESCTEYSYKDVLRNPDEYVGKRVKITAKVSSVHDKELLNPVKYYFAYTNDEYDMWLGDQYGVFDCREAEDPKILDDDVITVYGEISEPQETKSLIVNSQEIFCIDMKYAELISE